MRFKIYMILTGIIFLFTNCNDVLDRPSLTTSEDDAYWTSEDRVRLYANAFYTNFFVGYGLKYETTYAPNANYTFNDDAVRLSTQTQFGRTVPTSKGSTSLDMMWQSEFTGPTWNFAWIRKANVMLDRVSARMKDILTEEQYNHWMGIGRFFRGMEYARLVNVFGDVPYYDTEVLNTDKDALYKDRTPRNEVMDAVYDDFDFAMKNVRLDDGDAQYVNRYVVAAFVSRWALFEASWQKYYYKNDERAKKFFEQAIAAADLVMSSGKYDIVTDFRSLFGSTKSTKDCILYRTYDADKGVTHSIASTCNMNDPTDVGPNLDLIKAFICTDGKDWQTSAVANAADFTLSNLIKTRDARFEASFYNKPTPRAKSCYLYVTKFIPRSALEYIEKGGSPAPEFQGEKNVTDKGVTHSIASTCNMNDPTDVGPNLDLIKAFICTDGKDWQTSAVANAADFTLSNLIKTRDARFEASFYNKPTPRAKSCYLYVTKFIPRSALEYIEKGGSPAPEFQGEKNVTGYPVIRYAEVLLNWIEAKAELATLGGPAVVQTDIDESINKIRNRPIAEEAKALGVVRTADMKLDALPDDPGRDVTVSPLLWEIRRERRMEFAFEFSRIVDLRRWKKLEYMDTDRNQDLLVGTWVNFKDEVPEELKSENSGKIRVMGKDGSLTVYDGTNAAAMKGFFYPEQNKGRLPFLNVPNVNPYLSPIGINQIEDYKSRGYTLTQTEGWPASLN